MLDHSDISGVMPENGASGNGSGLIRDGVYDKIRADILTCALAPGAIIQEKDLAARYAVSKSPVRDALLRLQEQGLIEVLPRRGYRVQPISLADAKELYETRILLEKSCVKRAIETASEETLNALDKFRTTDATDQLAEWVTYNRDFHRAIADASGNARLAKMTQDVIDQFDRLTFVGVSEAPSGASADKLMKEHRDLIDAIQAREKTKAARLIGAHVSKSQRRLFAVLESRPIVD
jgi:DNA-binding GntR family transcriptional regulator